LQAVSFCLWRNVFFPEKPIKGKNLKYNPDKHHRHSIRLKGYDYSKIGLYFITICTRTIGIQMTDGTGKISGAQMRGYNVGAGFARPNTQMSSEQQDGQTPPLQTTVKPPMFLNNQTPFGKIENGKMILNEFGQIVETEWQNLKIKYPHITLHEYTIMPNHFHGIIEIVGVGSAHPETTNMNFENINIDTGDIRAGKPRPYNIALGNIIGYFKYQTTKKINLPVKLWQRDYFEHIIRNEQSYQKIAEYIVNNPANWQNDKFYTEEQQP